MRNQNAFDFLRLVAASSVLLSHSYALYGLAEPHLFAHADSLGTVSVAVFFALSGYLVCQSWDRDPNVVRFALRRAFRIFPGLAVAVFVTAFVIGPLATEIPLHLYFSSPETWRYFLGNSSLMVGASQLPGVFEDNPVKGPNGSLWSLRHEVLMYALLVLAGLTRQYRRMCLGVFIAFFVCWIVAVTLDVAQLAQSLPPPWRAAVEVHAMRALKLGALFFGASCLYLWRTRIRLSGIVAAVLTATLLWVPNKVLSSILLIVVIPYAALTFALRAPTFINRLVKNDLSYGIYIYAFPVQQLVCAYTVSRNIGWLVTLVVSGVLTLMFAALSWFLIERPALRLRPRTEPVVVEGLATGV